MIIYFLTAIIFIYALKRVLHLYSVSKLCFTPKTHGYINSMEYRN
jgi:hypothetical protein